MKRVMPKAGKRYSFKYPRHNFHGVLSRLEPRRIEVTSIRDIYEDRLDPATTSMQPLTKRCRWLVIGLDMDKNEERSFYLHSMQEVKVL